VEAEAGQEAGESQGLNAAMADASAVHSFGSIAPLFRGPFLERVAAGTHVSAILELADCYSGFNPPSRNSLLRDWFDFFYALMSERYRCEYVYKNAIASNLFLSRHSMQDSCLTNELRSGSSRADVAILNGTSTVYEVKSQFDSFDRLPTQLSDYLKIFDLIYVVTTETRSKALDGVIPENVGIIVMQPDTTLSTVRQAVSNKRNTNPSTIFDCMRQREFTDAVSEVYGELPPVPNSQIYRLAKELFCSLPSEQAHDLMVRYLKKRGKKKPFEDLIQAAPFSLKHACLSFSRSQAMALQINSRLKEPMS
jgi:hypothetical protein